nr:hydrolase family protein / HAD-superfamily protein [Tanacetum cinerariifolium]
MKFRTISRIIIQTRNKSSSIKFHSYRAISHFHSTPKRGSFGIAFDIDGVILRGTNPIGNSPNALKRLYNVDSESGQYGPWVEHVNFRIQHTGSCGLTLIEQRAWFHQLKNICY